MNNRRALRSAAPWVAHRSDLNYLLGELIAEFEHVRTPMSAAATNPKKPHISVGMLGAELRPDGGYYRIAKIYPGENWHEATRSPLTEPGLKVKAGDYLIAVNGRETKSSQEVYSYFQNLAGKQVALKVNSNPARKAPGKSPSSPPPMKTARAISSGSKPTARKSRTPPAAALVTCTCRTPASPASSSSTRPSTRSSTKDGIIVDERYNGGGNIPDFFTEKLRRILLGYIAGRDTKDVAWPPTAIHGPKS